MVAWAASWKLREVAKVTQRVEICPGVGKGLSKAPT